MLYALCENCLIVYHFFIMSLGTLYTKFKLNLTLQMFDILVETYNWILVVLMQFWYINLKG